MNEPNGLYTALAALQADLPRISKDNTADVKNAQGVKLYSYKFADLADVSQAILPKLAKHGLSFTSKPTLVDGQFVLAYRLAHVSGETDEGMYPLPAGGTPQAVGGAITYARRYCLCAVTGVAADGDDDDASGAEQSYRRSAGDVFAQAAPARPSNQGPGREVTAPPRRSERMAAVPEDDPWYTTGPAPEGKPQAARPKMAETDPAWLDLIGKEIDKITSRKDAEKVWAKIVAAFGDHTCTPADRKALEGMVGAKAAAVLNQAEATEGKDAA